MLELYSHSRLTSFESCPRKFHYRYVLRLPAESESIEGFLGKRVHEVLERLYQAAGRGLVPSVGKVLQRFRQLWQDAYDGQRVRIARPEHPPEHYRETGERCLAGFYRRHYPFDADETLGLEQRVAFALDERGRYRVQGIVDRVVRARDGALEIHDYKTSQRVPTQPQLDRDRQLALYQLGVAQHYGGEQPIRLVWHFLVHGQVRRSARTASELAALRADTMALIDRIRCERDFEPRPGPLCRWCEYNRVCPASAARPTPEAVQPGSPASAPASGARSEPEASGVHPGPGARSEPEASGVHPGPGARSEPKASGVHPGPLPPRGQLALL